MSIDGRPLPTERDYTLGFYIEYPALRDAVEIPKGFFSASADQRAAWEAICQLRAAGEPIQLVTIAEMCGENGNKTYLSEITLGLIPIKPVDFRRRVLKQAAKDIGYELKRRISADPDIDWHEVAAQTAEAERLELDAEGELKDLGLTLMSGAALQNLDFRVEWAIEGLLPARSLTLLYGRSGLGKTWLSLMIAKAVSTGLPILGLNTKARPVVYIDYENPLPVLIDRTRQLDIKDVQFWHLSAEIPPPKLDSDDWGIFKKLPSGSLLVFDTSRSSHSMDENASEAPALVMGRLKELRELGHDIILLHHTTKADDQNAKGSSGWYDLADHTLSFCRVRRGTFEEVDDGGAFDPGALLSLGVGKKTRFEPPPRLYLTLDPNAGGFSLALCPDDAAIDSLTEYITGPGRGQNQTAVFEWAKGAGVGPKRKDSFQALLSRGERMGRWTSERGSHGSRLYYPAS